VGLLLSACSKSSGEEQADNKKSPAPKSVAKASYGVSPDLFECDSVAPFAKVRALLGETTERTDSHFRPPHGVPRPCVYLRTVERPIEEPKDDKKHKKKKPRKKAADGEVQMEKKQQMFSFDLDCRDSARQVAADLMKQYTANAGDAGVEKVAIGKRGLDHHGVALIFIDDDTPCHVRVLGPDAEIRKALGGLVAKRLTKKTAPMRLSRRLLKKKRKKKH
jgi:hypothetical protein